MRAGRAGDYPQFYTVKIASENWGGENEDLINKNWENDWSKYDPKLQISTYIYSHTLLSDTLVPKKDI